LWLGEGGQKDSSEDLGKGKGFCHLPRFTARLLGCPSITPVTIPTELSTVTHISLFIDCHKCL